MFTTLDDTITALASPPGPAARGIIRISGPNVVERLNAVFTPDVPDRWKQNRTANRHTGIISLADNGLKLSVAVYLWPTPRSYTGQPMAELHMVGVQPLLEATLTMLFEGDIRPARPGEFTLRAFLSGRVDLVQAEAVLGVIDAPDHEELKLALKQLAGGISGKIGVVRSNLIDLLAELEAGLDFADEDIEFIDKKTLLDRTATAHRTLEQLLEQANVRMQSTGRLKIVLAGLPNAGKSTLFNALAGRSVALVSEIQGTTRDYLSTQLDWNGQSIELIDTAGWEVESDNIMQVAQGFLTEQLDQADVILWCRSAGLDESEENLDKRAVAVLEQQHHSILNVQTKCDLSDNSRQSKLIQVSARTGTGLNELCSIVLQQLSQTHRGDRQLLGATASRCRESLSSAVISLMSAHEAAERDAGEELIAIEIRDVLEHLGRILGSVYTDDILDRIFSKFCIGK